MHYSFIILVNPVPDCIDVEGETVVEPRALLPEGETMDSLPPYGISRIDDSLLGQKPGEETWAFYGPHEVPKLVGTTTTWKTIAHCIKNRKPFMIEGIEGSFFGDKNHFKIRPSGQDLPSTSLRLDFADKFADAIEATFGG